MTSLRCRCRGIRPFGLSVLALLLLLPAAQFPAATAEDNDGPRILRVEEDWLLTLLEPREAVFAPQFHTLMSPVDHTDGYYAQVTWNYRELPETSAGGLQLQLWHGEDDLNTRSVREDAFSSDAETVTWTQALAVGGGRLRFSLYNGQSQSWGAFGGPDVQVALNTTVTDLNGYSPAVSTANSWISYGQNRVQRLALLRVRYYSAAGLIATDEAQRTVFEYLGQ